MILATLIVCLAGSLFCAIVGCSIGAIFGFAGTGALIGLSVWFGLGLAKTLVGLVLALVFPMREFKTWKDVGDYALGLIVLGTMNLLTGPLPIVPTPL